MRKITKMILTAIVAVSLVLPMSMIAAASTQNTTFRVVTVKSYFDTYILLRDKEDASACYLRIDTYTANSNYVQVRACGMNAGSTTPVNRTCLANGTSVGCVVCRVGERYSVHSTIYENGHPSATLQFRANDNVGTGYVSGVWSADSQGHYTDAT